MEQTDPLALSQALIRCPSVTPKDEGALGVLEDALSNAGFTCLRADRGGIANLFARFGPKGHPRTLGFNGHTDVVPPGDPTHWSRPPFSGEVSDGRLWGRGAADMKTGVAAFAAAAIDFASNEAFDGAIILTITGDEEGDATDGTVALLDFMDTEGEAMSACLVGEPTCPDWMGQMIKIGRRGSMTVWFTARGVQGHSAYPDRAKNPVSAMSQLMARLSTHSLDDGTEYFDRSTLAVTTIDVGNPAQNVIPAECRGTVNIRFNDAHSSATLTDWLRSEAARVSSKTGVEIDMKIKVSGESFLTPPGPFVDLVRASIEAETGHLPELSTTGGTSDARFIKDHCPVLEFGLVGRTMHQVDESVAVEDVGTLKTVYGRIIRDYFKG